MTMPDLSGMMNSMGIVIFAVITCVFAPIILGLLWFALRSRRRVHESLTTWERTTGTVLMSMVETRRSHSHDGGYSTAYYPKVVYQYNVMGQQYTSERFNLGEVGLGFYNRVAAKVAQYPQGKMIDVYYNPANPVEAVLERAAPSSNILLFVVLVFVVILACTGIMTFGAFAVAGQFANNINNVVNQITTTLTPR